MGDFLRLFIAALLIFGAPIPTQAMDIGKIFSDGCHYAMLLLEGFKADRNIDMATKVKDGRFKEFVLVPRDVFVYDPLYKIIRPNPRPETSGYRDTLTGLNFFTEHGSIVFELPTQIESMESQMRFPIPAKLRRRLFTSEER